MNFFFYSENKASLHVYEGNEHIPEHYRDCIEKKYLYSQKQDPDGVICKSANGFHS